MTWTTPATPTSGTAITVAFWNTNARDNLSHLRSLVPDPGGSGKILTSDGSTSAAWVTPASTFSAGMVMYWNASSASIPSGWTELTAARDRFIIGANNLYSYNATGGATTANLAHTHTVNSHTHSFSSAHTHTIATHTHSISLTAAAISAGLYSYADQTGDPRDVDMPPANHTHTVSGTSGAGGNNTDSGTASGTSGTATPGTDSQLSSTQSILPPYIALTVMVKSA